MSKYFLNNKKNECLPKNALSIYIKMVECFQFMLEKLSGDYVLFWGKIAFVILQYILLYEHNKAKTG